MKRKSWTSGVAKKPMVLILLTNILLEKMLSKCDVDTEKLPFPDNYFDEVYSKNLLEHLRNPGFALKEMIRV